VVDGTNSSETTFPVGISNLVGLGDIIAAAAGSEDAALNVLSNLGSGLTLGVGAETSSGVRYGLILKALQTDSAANILSTPSIVTLDNEEAEIIVAQNLPFITGQFTGAGTTNPQNPFQTIERQDVGLTLRVTPQINEGDTIKLDIEQEVSDVVTITENSGPVTRKRSIKTSVLVDDGGILVLGGLIEEIVDDTQSKVPLLGDIPVLGWLFTSRASTKRKQNLMVFLKPEILRDFNDSAYVTNEKYNYLRAEQIRDEDEDFGLIKGAPVLPPLEQEIPGQAAQTEAKKADNAAPDEQEPATSSQQAEDDSDLDDDEDFF
jgi:general secretion pathway protein D